MTRSFPTNIDFSIVLGCPRSGTTFLMRLLDTLPRTECVNGIIIPSALSQIVNYPLPPAIYEALVIEFKQSLLRYMHSGFFNARAAAVHKWLQAPDLGGLWSAFQGTRAVERMIYKEPFLSLAPAFVYEALSEARFIHIYRDGRDCAASLVRTYDVLTDEKLTSLESTEMRLGRKVDHRYVPLWVEEGAEEAFLAATPYGRALWMWKTMVQRCQETFARPDIAASGQVLSLSYEDLMRDPQTYGQVVADHLGVPLNKWFRKRLKGAHTRSIGLYKQRPAEEIREAERIAGDELRLYGYL